MKRTANRILMWWCIALAVVGIVIFATGSTWGIFQTIISCFIAYTAYRKAYGTEVDKEKVERQQTRNKFREAGFEDKDIKSTVFGTYVNVTPENKDKIEEIISNKKGPLDSDYFLDSTGDSKKTIYYSREGLSEDEKIREMSRYMCEGDNVLREEGNIVYLRGEGNNGS